jgi:sensor c-di-GMP phosphodiesterase-like protein
MQKSKIVLLGVALAVIGVIVPIGLMVWLSWQSAQHAEQQRLDAFARQAIDRANMTINQARYALKSLSPLMLRPCSPDHIARMRQLSVNSRAVAEIGYHEYRILKCTSWGLVNQHIDQNLADFMIPDSMEIKTRMTPIVSGGDTMMSVQYGAHNALINLAQFADIIIDKGMHLTLARTGGAILASSGISVEDNLIEQLIAGTLSPEQDHYYHALVKTPDWTAVVVADKNSVLLNLRRIQLWMLPLGAFISLFIVFLVIRLSRSRLSPLAELRLAVKKKEFVVHYQPILDLKTGRCIGAEALVRWRRPDGALARPDLFIPLAEDSGLIIPITDQVIETVIRELKKELAADRSLHIAINLCADDIRTGRVLPVIAEALDKTGIHPGQIWLEATEHGFMDITSARVTLSKAREMGHSTAIDDFGTGYSSLQYLQGLPMDALKIDKSFVNTIGTGAVSSAVIGHIIDMAKSLNLFIVAEGVERQDQADYLAEKGVDFAQGWLYTKAMPAKEFLRFYQKTLESYGAGPENIPEKKEVDINPA